MGPRAQVMDFVEQVKCRELVEPSGPRERRSERSRADSGQHPASVLPVPICSHLI